MSRRGVRRPAVAGRFYPADPALLREQVDRYIAAGELTSAVPQALIAPHAGYLYSGPVAGSAYAHLANRPRPITRVILLGPAHTVSFPGLALSGVGAFATPLGEVALDEDGCARAADFEQVAIDEEPHRPEHSLEVQLPFLQRCCPEAAIVPLLTGRVGAGAVAGVVEALWSGPETLVVVSSDLSHFFDGRTAARIDGETAVDVTLLRPLAAGQACGYRAINGLLAAARRRGVTAAAVDVRHSGQTAGDSARVVGYGAFIFSERVAVGED